MRIEQNTQYSNQNIGLGANLKGLSDNVYLLITSPNGVSMKVKIGNAGNSESESLADVQKAKKNTGIANYENNIDAFFEEKGGTSLVS